MFLTLNRRVRFHCLRGLGSPLIYTYRSDRIRIGTLSLHIKKSQLAWRLSRRVFIAEKNDKNKKYSYGPRNLIEHVCWSEG